MRSLLLLALAKFVGCAPAAAKTDPKLEQFFIEWLKGHGEMNIASTTKRQPSWP